MPIFLSQQQVYRLLQRELPIENVYPDGPASAFYSTAENYSVAKVFGDAYTSLESIYNNYFPQTADVRQQDWEELILGRHLPDSLTLQEKRDRVLTKIRTRRRTTPQDIIDIVHTVIDSSISVEIAPWGCGCAGWILDVSILDVSTILNGYNNLNLVGPDLCGKTAADFGLTEDEFLDYRKEAYFYEIRIYSYTLSSEERDLINKLVSEGEPARSDHIIVDGLDPADMLEDSCA